MNARPKLVLILGGPASGKTRFRRDKFSDGFVTIDAGEIFLLLPESANSDFPGPLEAEMDGLGRTIAKSAVFRRLDIVTEMIGDSVEDIVTVTNAMKAAGYEVIANALVCDVNVAMQRNMQRGPDNISAYYTQKYHQKWLTEAAHDFVQAKT